MRKDLLAIGLGVVLSSVSIFSDLHAQGVQSSPPPPPYGSTMADLNGGNPNGSWLLFLQDDAPVSSGMVRNGWILTLSTANLVGSASDVELLMHTSSTNVFIGQPATFVLTVTNYGPSASTNIVVTDTLPPNVTLVSTNATQGTVSGSGTTLSWNVGNLALNTGAALTVTVQPQTTGSLVNSAVVSTSTPDPNPDDDSAVASVAFVPFSATLMPSFSNGALHITMPGPTNRTVVIQVSTNLASTNWVNVYTSTPPVDFVDPAPAGTTGRFYRALLLP